MTSRDKGIASGVAGVAALCLWLFQCSIGGTDKTYNETQAIARLRQYQTAQFMFQEMGSEGEGRFAARLPDLYNPPGMPGQKLIPQGMAKAWGGSPAPEPYDGYLFLELKTKADGSPVSFEGEFGLCAYPAKPGKTGDIIYLLLLDGMTPELWARKCETGMSLPVTVWPTPEELNRSYRAF